MKFVDIEIFVGQKETDTLSGTIILPINPLQVVMIVPTPVPGEIAGPNGQSTMKIKAGLDLGIKKILTNEDVEDVRKKIEDAINGVESNANLLSTNIISGNSIRSA